MTCVWNKEYGWCTRICSPGFPATNKPRPTTHNGEYLVYIAWGNLPSTDINLVRQGGWRWFRRDWLQAKRATHYLLRIQQQHDSSDTLTAAWLGQWRLFQQTENPPVLHHMHQALTYLRSFFLEWAYVGRRLEGETSRALKRRVYGVLREYNSKSTPPTPYGYMNDILVRIGDPFGGT
jgi:hypothetical protein